MRILGIDIGKDRERLTMRLCVALLLLTLVAGCGFHLQGSYHPPEGVDGVYVVYHNAYQPGEPPLVDSLQQRLRMLGILGGPGADVRLVIRSVSTRRSGVSISPIDSDTVEYRLQSSVVFDYIVNNRQVLTDEQFSVTRYYSYNDTARLAAEAERRDLRKSMQDQLADRIMFRISNVDYQGGSSGMKDQ